MDPKRIIKEGYDQIAADYAASTAEMRVEERERYTDLILKALPEGAEVLDLGCGAGVPTTQVLAQRFDVTGVDLSEAQLALARQHVPGGRFIQGDMAALDLPPGHFDAVVAFYAFIHVPRDEQAELLQRIAGWLRPGGLLVMSMGTHPGEADVDDFFGVPMYWSGFDAETNRRMVEDAGLEIVTAREETADEFGDAVTFLWVVARKPVERVGQ